MVRLWDAEDGAQIDALPGPSNDVRRVIFSPDGKTLAATGVEVTDDRTTMESLYLWDVATLTEIAVIKTAERKCWQTASFSPDSHTLAYAGR